MPDDEPQRGRLVLTPGEIRNLDPEEIRLFGPKRRVRDLWLEVDLGEGWRAALRLVPYPTGEPVIAEARFFPADEWRDRRPGRWRAHALGLRSAAFDKRHDRPRTEDEGLRFPVIGQGVTGEVVRRLRFGEVLRRHSEELTAYLADARDDLRKLDEMMNDPNVPDEEFRARLDKVSQDGTLEMDAVGFKPTQSRRSDAWSDRRYAEIAATYVARYPTSRSPVKDVAEHHDLKHAQARDALNTARERGILTRPARKGQPGGRLTAYGKQLLEEDHDQEDTDGLDS